jgi:hypothetical protein
MAELESPKVRAENLQARSTIQSILFIAKRIRQSLHENCQINPVSFKKEKSAD